MNKKILVTSVLATTLLLASCGTQTPKETMPNLTGGGATMPISTGVPSVTETDKKVEKIQVTILTDTSYFKEQKSIDNLITRIKQESFLKDATITVLDFSKDSEKQQVVDLMNKNKSELLPLVFLNTDQLNDNGVMSNSLSKLDSGDFKLNVQSFYNFYNPITKEEINPNVISGQLNEDIKIETSGLLFGKTDARYSILMFSDFDCPYCKQSNESNKFNEIVQVVEPSGTNIIYKHFPLTEIHPKSNIKSLLAISETLKNKKLDKALLTKYFNLTTDVSLDGQDVTQAQKVLDENIALGKTFGIQGTPTLVIYDNETNKYISLPELMSAQEIKIEFEKFITSTNVELQPTVQAEGATIVPVNESEIEEVMEKLETEDKN